MARLGPICQVLLCVAVVLSGCYSSASEEEPNYARLGSEAYATRHPFPNLLVEIDHAPQYAPSSFALDALRAMLLDYAEKDRIVLLEPTSLPEEARFLSDDKNWMGEEIALHEEFFDSGPASAVKYGVNDTAQLHIMYLNGVYEGSASAAQGLATARTIFMFPSYYRAAEGSPISVVQRVVPDDGPARIERRTLIHEMGHMMGLVNNGAPMVRPHDDGGTHSNNPQSVMSHLPPDALFRSEALGTDYPYQFDADDIADLRHLQAEAGRRRGG